MKNKLLGIRGEQLAVDYLQSNGYYIIERNWRAGRMEIDVIGTVETTLVFVEVKTRQSEAFGDPEEAVTWKKQQHIKIASQAFLSKIKHKGEIRFDIISVMVYNHNAAKITHFKDAFFPGLGRFS